MKNNKLKQNILFGSGEASITPNNYNNIGLSGYGRKETCKGVHDLIYVRANVFSIKNEIKLVLLNYEKRK